MKVYALALAVSLAVLFTAGEGRASSYFGGQKLYVACSDEESMFRKSVCLSLRHYLSAGAYSAGSPRLN